MESQENVASEVPSMPSSEDLGPELRRLRRWLVALTVVVAILFACTACVVSFSVAGVLGLSSMDVPGSEDAKADLESTIREAYGSDLRSLEVRKVKGEVVAPFPYSLLEGSMSEFLAVTYRIEGSDVEFADVTYGEMDIGYSGLVPPRNALESRLEGERLLALLEAYDEETDKPAGGVLRYGTASYYEGPAPAREQTITVSGTDYDTSELWLVREGRKIEGDTVPMEYDSSALAYVFHLDETKGTFTFVGTEPSDSGPF